MNARQLLWTALLATLLAGGCNEDTPDADAGPDPGADAAAPDDAGRPTDAGSDAGGDGCVQATVSDWRLQEMDDVSIRYRARFAPEVEDRPVDLILWFNRYATEYVGEFPLGEGDDANFGSCARCVMGLYGPALEHGFFATEGTLTLREDPFTQRLDATLTGVRLVEVTITADATGAIISTPVEDGACIDLAETTISGNFPTPGWTCDTDQFNDGATCDCGCGAFDPDCGDRCNDFPPDPSCDPTPLPVAGCTTDQLCTFEGECVDTCSFWGRDGCTSGVCAFVPEGDRCLTPSEDRVDSALIDETCIAGNWLCAVDDEGFAMGVCDDLDEWRCKPACDADEDCPLSGEMCHILYDDGTRRHGYCRGPIPTDG